MFTERKLLKVYLEQDEYKWIELQAGGSVSEWCREKLLEERDNRMAHVPRAREVFTPERSVGAPERLGIVSTVPSLCQCGHPRHKHGGFGGACQDDICRCGGYR